MLLGCLAASGLWGQQVLLRVRFAQVDARAERLLAPSLLETSNHDFRTLRGDVDLVTLLENLRARGGGVRLVAEPTLLTAGAKPGKLLVGDTVPIPVLRAGQVVVQNREIGVQLTMQPTINAEGIRLSIRPSVSVIYRSPAAQMTIPELGTRTTDVELDVAPGQSIVIDGLFDDLTKALLRNLPPNKISEAILKNGTDPNTKLLVIVTPEVL
ncbi:MAG: hypothetical protein ABIR70_07265 [Bryobacteraceae bacterium]